MTNYLIRSESERYVIKKFFPKLQKYATDNLLKQLKIIGS